MNDYLTLHVNKVFAVRALLVLLFVVGCYGSYRNGYNKGLRDMARYAMETLKQSMPSPGIGDDETGHGSIK